MKESCLPSWERELLDAPIVDVHEHHIPTIFLSNRVHLLDLFRHSYAAWTLRRPYPLPSEHEREDSSEPVMESFGWEHLSPYLDQRGSNSFVRNLSRGILAIHGVEDAKEIHQGNWEALNARVIQSHLQKGFQANILKRANITRVITDDYTDPLLDARTCFGSGYYSVMRINAFALGWHPDSKDHNGNSAMQLLDRAGLHPETFEDYLEALGFLTRQMKNRGQLALKNALAYDRSISFSAPNLDLARRAWGKRNPAETEKLAFGDYIADHFCKLAAEIDVPIQMHLGTALIRGSHPMHVAGLVERNPGTRFLLMHLAYPWSRDLLAMAFVYRNIWIDLTWSWLLSPSHFESALHEAIEILPDEGRMMLGGDNWHIEETFGTMQTFRQLLLKTFHEKVVSGYFSERDALRLGHRILHENAQSFFAHA
ncbi:MAG: amidohydrolase family protein [Verrucomicrobiota bacterium]|nr:amidohydrolase [Verrucomicrobiota bacterium]MDG1889687.1 amidohydrolase family protein [Verrucomicrobiota bacterium]